MTSPERKIRVAQKIRALLAKTLDSGCSEAEALTAAAKAQELLEKYQISLSETEIRAEGAATAKFAAQKSKYSFTVPERIYGPIAHFCDCRGWRNLDNGKIHFLGLESDSSFAHWLTEALEAFCWAQADNFEDEMLLSTDEIPSWTHIRSFLEGIIFRINERLYEETDKRKSAAEATGTALIVLKDQIVTEAFAKLNLRLVRARPNSSRIGSAAAYSAGKAAGNRANFARPMGSSAPQHRIK